MSIAVCRIYFLPMWSKMEAKLLTNGDAPGTAAGAAKSAHLVRSIPGITPLRHGTLGFLQKRDAMVYHTCTRLDCASDLMTTEYTYRIGDQDPEVRLLYHPV